MGDMGWGWGCEVQTHRDVGMWDMEILRHGDLEVAPMGKRDMWEQGDVEIWNMGTWGWGTGGVPAWGYGLWGPQLNGCGTWGHHDGDVALGDWEIGTQCGTRIVGISALGTGPPAPHTAPGGFQQTVSPTGH